MISFITQYNVVASQKLEFVLKRNIESVDLALYDNLEKVKETYEEVVEEFNSQTSMKK